MVTTLFPVLIVLVIMMFLYGLFSYKNYIAFIREKHNDVCVSLGSPSLIMNNSPSSSLNVLRFLWHKDYLEFNDEEFTDQSKKMILMYRLYFAVISLVFALFLIVFVNGF